MRVIAWRMRFVCEENTILKCEEKNVWSIWIIAVYWVFKYDWRLICWDCI
jgi:hypothetical protein